MSRLWGGWLLAAALALSGCAPLKLSQATKASAAAASPAFAERPDYSYWPHEASDLAPDPSVRYGALANGMRYAILRNTQPAGAASARLFIASGSLLEAEDQRGLAHFLEHMAFNGSRNVPEGEMVKMLERLGLAFGPDTNASTGQEQTIYQLDLPAADAERVDAALFLFREIADRLLLDPGAIERERGVVLAEARARDTPDYRAAIASAAVEFPNSLLIRRWPIGEEDVLRSAPAEAFRRYYHTYYRPERMLLALVGDFDVAAVEGKVREAFQDWRPSAPDGPDPDPGEPREAKLAASGHFEPSLPERISVTWLQPPEAPLQTRARTLLELQRRVAVAVLNQRFSDRAREGDAPFIGAGFGHGLAVDLALSAGLSLTPKPGRLEEALLEAQYVLRQALRFGFSEAEVGRVRSDLRAGAEAAAAGEDTRDTRALAAGLVAAFNGRSVFRKPSQALALLQELEGDLTPQTALAALRGLAEAGEPLLFLTGPAAPPGGLERVESIWRDGLAKPVTPYEAQDLGAFPYAEFGAPGRLVEQGFIDDLGVYTYRFANGVRLNVKQTSFNKDRIQVRARIAGGRLLQPKEVIGWGNFAPSLFSEGGLGKLTAAELGRALTGRLVGVSLEVEDDAFELSGSTTPKDIELQMQLLAAFLVDPAFRADPLERLKASGENIITNLQGTPGGVLSRDLPGILAGGDFRWRFPTIDDIDALGVADVQRVLAPALAANPLEVAIVGDIAPERAAQAVAATLGALSARGDFAPEPGAERLRLPGPGAAFTLVHGGAPDQAVLRLIWPAPDFSDPRRARAAELLAQLLDVRLTEEVRERQGAAYSPSAGSAASEAFPGYGYVMVGVQTRPDLLAAFEQSVAEITAELREGRFDADLVERARAPLLERARNARNTNGFWLSAIADAQTNPEGLAAVRSRIPDLQNISAAEIAAMAQQVLGAAPVRVLATPSQPGASASAP